MAQRRMLLTLHWIGPNMSPDVLADLAPTSVLRAGINLSNFLLVTGIRSTGDPEGVAPDLANEVAMRLDVPIKYVPFKSFGELADMAASGIWDVGLIGAEPQRARRSHLAPPTPKSSNISSAILFIIESSPKGSTCWTRRRL